MMAGNGQRAERNVLNDDQMDEIVKLYKNGLSTTEIAAMRGLQPEHVRYTLKRRGVARRQRRGRIA